MDLFRPFYITRRMPRHLPSLPMRNVIVTVNEQLLTYFLRIRKAIARMRTGRGARWLVAAPANHLAPSSASTSSAKVSEYNTTTYISYLQVSYSLILILLGSEHLISKIRFSIWMFFLKGFLHRLRHHTLLRGQCSFRIRAFCGIGLTKWNMALVW